MTRLKRNLISTFIVFNIAAVLIGVGRRNEVDLTPVQKIFMPYLVWTRLLQHWELFVPAPRKYALKYHAEISFKDGTTKSWQRPYPPNWDFFERHLSYNFQKWDLAAGYLEQRDLLWRDLTDFLLRIYANDQNPPVSVTFIRSKAERQPPHEEGYVMHEDSELQWNDSVVFKYDVATKTFNGRTEP